MTDMPPPHLDPEMLSARLDGELAPADVDRVEAHLRVCAACARRLRNMGQLVASARALARDVPPPADAWTGLRDRVARESYRTTARRWWAGAGTAVVLAAAGVVLAVGVGGLVPDASPKAKVAAPPPPVAAAVAVERNYIETVAQLRQALDAQRQHLAPSTVYTVERSLAVIDSAIAEAGAALAVDPANQDVIDILSAQYAHKISLLTRATELSSSL